MFLIRNTYARGKVIRRKIDADRNYVGRSNNNPILDTREYCVEIDDGDVSKLTANMIAESMYAAFDDSINGYLIMELILYYRNNDKSITVPDKKVLHRGQVFMRRSNVGCQLCVQWIYGSKSWQALKDLK